MVGWAMERGYNVHLEGMRVMIEGILEGKH